MSEKEPMDEEEVAAHLELIYAHEDNDLSPNDKRALLQAGYWVLERKRDVALRARESLVQEVVRTWNEYFAEYERNGNSTGMGQLFAAHSNACRQLAGWKP